MKDTLKEKCDLLTENRDIVNKGFMLELEHSVIAVALIYTDKGLKADAAHMKECKKILKKSQGMFSDFRSSSELTVIAKMATSDDPEAYIKNVIDIYNSVRNGKFFTSEHMALAALSIADLGKKEQADAIAEKTRNILERMRKLHPFLASMEDLSFVSLLAVTDKSIDQIIEDVEACYELLKDKFHFHSNAVYSLCQIIAISGGNSEEKCAKVMEIYNAMKDRKVKYGKEYELASLGALVNMNVDTDTLVSEIIETSEYLKDHKGFGNFAIGKEMRHMFAALMTASVYSSNEQSSAAIGGAIAAAIAQQIATLIVMTAVMTTVAVSSTTN